MEFFKTFSMVFCIVIFFSFFFIGILVFSSNDILLSEPVEYYENNIKIDAIKYNNEIYVKKGE